MRNQSSAAMRAVERTGRQVLSLAMALFLACVFTLTAQERFGELNGTATDATGAVLPNVKVTITENNSKRTYTSVTSTSGTYVDRNHEPRHRTVYDRLRTASDEAARSQHRLGQRV